MHANNVHSLPPYKFTGFCLTGLFLRAYHMPFRIQVSTKEPIKIIVAGCFTGRKPFPTLNQQ